MANGEFKGKIIDLKYPILSKSSDSNASHCKSAYIASDFGRRTLRGSSSYHCGIDLVYADKSGNGYICAAERGKVELCVRGHADCGNYIELLHNNNYRTRYMHMANEAFGTSPFPDYIKKGVIVEKGTILGKMGSTGNSTGNHLHFDIRQAPNTSNKYLPDRVDPYPFLASGTKTIPSYKYGNSVSTTTITSKPRFKNHEKVIVNKNTKAYLQPNTTNGYIIIDKSLITKIISVTENARNPYKIYIDHSGTVGYIRDADVRAFSESAKSLDESFYLVGAYKNTVNVWLIDTTENIDKFESFDQINKLAKNNLKTYQYGVDLYDENSISNILNNIIKNTPSGYKSCLAVRYTAELADSTKKIDEFLDLTVAANLNHTFTQQFTKNSYTLDFYYVPATFNLKYHGYDDNGESYEKYIQKEIVFGSSFYLKSIDELGLKRDFFDFLGWSTSKDIDPNLNDIDTETWGISFTDTEQKWLFAKDVDLYPRYLKRSLSEFQINLSDTSDNVLPDFYTSINEGESSLCLSEYSYKYKNADNENITNNTNISAFNSDVLIGKNINREYSIIEETLNGVLYDYFPYFKRVINPFVNIDVNRLSNIKNQKVALKGCFPTFESQQTYLLYDKNYLKDGLCTYIIERTDTYLSIKTANGKFESKIAKDSFKDNTVPYQLLAVATGAGGQGACLSLDSFGNTYGKGGDSGCAAAFLINLFDSKAYITVGKANYNYNDSNNIGINNGSNGSDTIITVISNTDKDKQDSYKYSKLVLQGGKGGNLRTTGLEVSKIIYESNSDVSYIQILKSQESCVGNAYIDGKNCEEFRACVANERIISNIYNLPYIGDTGFYYIQPGNEGGTCIQKIGTSDQTKNLKFFVGGGGASIFGDGGDAISCADYVKNPQELSYGAGGSGTYVEASDASVIAGGKGGDGIFYLYY